MFREEMGTDLQSSSTGDTLAARYCEVDSRHGLAVMEIRRKRVCTQSFAAFGRSRGFCFCERYVSRILRKVIAMERLAEARGVQLKNSRPLSLPRRSASAGVVRAPRSTS